HPYFVDIDSHLNGAKVMLTQYNLHHMPVKKDDDIVGIISLRDIERAEIHGVDTSIGTDVRVREVCQPAISSIVEPGTPLKTVLQKMADEHLECVVIATDSHLEGIFTVTDACKRYAQSLE
ncbi:MAG: CBS domain-containing protein, partial [Proteobacteria bacterium]|nr:CBS domain-containing protein [Pseudomonadota bacterium]